MNNVEKMQFIRMVADALFTAKASNLNMLGIIIQHPNIVDSTGLTTGKAQGRWFKNAETGQQTIRGFDVNLNVNDRVLSLRFMEQNPDKTDGRGNLKWTAALARKGHKMMWVVNRSVQVGGFLGRLQDGEWIPSQERAYTPANNQAAPARSAMENIPDIPADVGIPEYTLQSYANMEDE